MTTHRQIAILLVVLGLLTALFGCVRQEPTQSAGEDVTPGRRGTQVALEPAAVRSLLQGSYQEFSGVPLRPGPDAVRLDPETGQMKIEARVGDAVVSVSRRSVESGSSQLSAPEIVTIQVSANGVSEAVEIAVHQDFVGAAIGEFYPVSGGVVGVVEVTQQSVGSGGGWQTVAVLVILPGAGDAGRPTIEGWLPVVSYANAGIGHWTAETSEIYLREDTSLLAISLLAWERNGKGVDPIAPWRESATAFIQRDGLEATDCADQSDVCGAAIVVAESLEPDLTRLSGGLIRPWRFCDMEAARVAGIAAFDPESPPAFIPEDTFMTAVRRLSEPTCLIVGDSR